MYFHSFNELLETKNTIVVENGANQHALSSAINRSRQSNGVRAWDAPNVITLDNSINTTYDLYSLKLGSDLGERFLLSREQERVLWRNTIAADAVIDARAPDKIAHLAQDAWYLKNMWGLRNDQLDVTYSPDVEAFCRWGDDFSRLLEKTGAIDRGTFISNYIAENHNTNFTAQGFRWPSPVLRSWLKQDDLLCEPKGQLNTSNFVGHVYDNFEDELHEALLWASCTSAKEPNSRVVVGVESFSIHTDEVQRCCSDVFGDAGDGSEIQYSMKRQDLLASYPVIQIAVLILDVTPLCKWDVLSELIRHPLLKGADEERHQRAVFDSRLRDENRYEVDLKLVVKRLEQSDDCPYLLEFFRLMESSFLTRPQKNSLAYWISDFNNILKLVGVNGLLEKTTLRKDLEIHWDRVCDQVITLDAVMDFISRGEALSFLKRQLQERSVSEGGKSAGIFIMPAEEAYVLDPTHLWIVNANSSAFAPTYALSPFLSIIEQRLAGVQGAHSEKEKTIIELNLSMLGRLGEEHHVSYSRFEGDDKVSPSPFFPELGNTESSAKNRYIPVGWKQPHAQTETYSDFIGPALQPSEILVSGVSVFSDQSACAFQAFARHRLKAVPVFEPTPGINFREKGVAVHRVLAAFWGGLKNSSTLQKLSLVERSKYINGILQEQLKRKYLATPIEHELFLLEINRLTALIQNWSDFEINLESFEVIAQEEKVAVNIFGVPVRIKPDRIDQLEDGSIRIVDYKTGDCVVKDWLVPRLKAPQLPIYALFHPSVDATSIAFACVNLSAPRWIELPTDDAASPDSWSDWVNSWKQDIQVLAEEILNGVATPEQGVKDICAYCEQAASSLVNESGINIPKKLIE